MTPHGIFSELSAGLDEIGKGFEGKGGTRYFTSDLIVSGRNMKRALEILRPHFPKGGKGRGLVILGTVKGDVHDIGKMIFAVTLESNGFSCIDLGVDVDRDLFAESVARHRPDILSLSALLSSTLPAMGEVLEELETPWVAGEPEGHRGRPRRHRGVRSRDQGRRLWQGRHRRAEEVLCLRRG